MEGIALHDKIDKINKKCNVMRYFLAKRDEVEEYYNSLSFDERKEFKSKLDKEDFKGILKDMNGGKGKNIRDLQTIARRAGVYKYSHMSKETLKKRLEQDGLL